VSLSRRASRAGQHPHQTTARREREFASQIDTGIALGDGAGWPIL
jgi:hypothetical protein